MENQDEITKKIKKILVVEDEASVSKSLYEKLTQEKFQVIVARDGEEGLRVALAEIPDLILLDIVMPKMDGMAMMKKLRAENSYGKNVPIILLTNSSETEEINRGITEDEPAYYFIKADWSLDDLVGKIKERLEQKI